MLKFMNFHIIRPTKPLIGNLVLKDGVLLLRDPPGYFREQLRDVLYIGDAVIKFGGEIPYFYGEEKVRLPLSNASLTIEIVDVDSGEIFDEISYVKTPYNPDKRYIERVKYYSIDSKQVDEYFHRWRDYRKERMDQKNLDAFILN